MYAVFCSRRMKEARLQKNMTQEQLAEACQTSDRYIRDLECGRKSHPSAAMLCLLAASLDISMTELISVHHDESL